MRTRNLIVALAAALAFVGCKKEDKKDEKQDEKKEEPAAKSKEDPEAKEEPTAVTKDEPTPVTKEDPAATKPADGTEEPKPDPIEQGLDMKWQDETDGCKPTLDDKDKAFQTAYGELCTKALAKLAGCASDKDFLAKANTAASGEDTATLLKAQVGNSKAIKETCETLAHDQLCLYQGRTWANAYDASTVRAMGDAADCNALLAVFPEPLYYTGE
jgi:hypothetical protein